MYVRPVILLEMDLVIPHAFPLFSNEMLRCSNTCCFQFPFCTQLGCELDHRYLLWPTCGDAANSETRQNMVRGIVSCRSLLRSRQGRKILMLSDPMLSGLKEILPHTLLPVLSQSSAWKLFRLIRSSHQAHSRHRRLWVNVLWGWQPNEQIVSPLNTDLILLFLHWAFLSVCTFLCFSLRAKPGLAVSVKGWTKAGEQG